MPSPSENDIAHDIRVAEFLETLPRDMPFEETANRLLFLFGPDHGWPIERIRGYFGKNPDQLPTAAQRRSAFRFAEHPEIVLFIRQEASRHTLTEIAAMLLLAFPDKTVPSRSTIHRFLQRDQNRR